jgi:hypothetical protein
VAFYSALVAFLRIATGLLRKINKRLQENDVRRRFADELRNRTKRLAQQMESLRLRHDLEHRRPERMREDDGFRRD